MITKYPDCAVIIVAAGSGERTGLGYNKVLHKVAGKTMLEHTLSKFDMPKVVVAAQNDYHHISKITANLTSTIVVKGGNTRSDSVKAGLGVVHDADIVLIHDAARPNISPELIHTLITECRIHSSAIPYLPMTDTIKNLDGQPIARQNLLALQTPQVFNRVRITKAHILNTQAATDDSQIYETMYNQAHYVRGSSDNYKITLKSDLTRWEREMIQFDIRCGQGYDIHRLIPGRRLILGGVEIAHDKGLDGHSDADVLTHSIMDALLSALALGDIGTHFADTDPAYKDISSLDLLKHVHSLLQNHGYGVINISAVIIAQQPKLSAHISAMRNNIAQVLGISPQNIGISASTNEKLGALGRSEGIACITNCLLSKTPFQADSE